MRFTRNNKNAFYFNFKRNFLNFKEKLIIVNRLILVGNGFDLAHGLKTNYKDFIDDFWKESLKPISEAYPISILNNKEGLFQIYCNIEINQQIKDYNSLYSYLYSDEDEENHLHINYYNSFFEKLMKSFSDKNWVDIENEYYNELKKTKNIDKLNSDFEEIKKLLIEYLNKIEKPSVVNRKICDKIYSYFKLQDFSLDAINTKAKLDFEKRKKTIEALETGNIDLNDASDNQYEKEILFQLIGGNKESTLRGILENGNTKKLDRLSMLPEEILILNFNYTDTIFNYVINKYCNKKELLINFNNIHGNLNEINQNPIIFGFGDDVDKKYQEFEDLNDNRYLENFKSIAYLQIDNYKKLLEFIDSEEYQVFIFGHSCGISDRTMLNTIFEHDNCKSIKPFYHKREDGTDNYTELVQNISRNFNDKKKYRDRVVNKTYCEPLT